MVFSLYNAWFIMLSGGLPFTDDGLPQLFGSSLAFFLTQLLPIVRWLASFRNQLSGKAQGQLGAVRPRAFHYAGKPHVAV